MKRAFLFLLVISCAGFILAQDIVVTKAGTTIEDVKVISITADNVTYNQAGTQKTMASSEVDGVLYSDGRYVTPPSQQIIPSDEVSSSDGSWDMEDYPQQQNYIGEESKGMSNVSHIHTEKTTSSNAKEEKKRKREANKACLEEATQAFFSNFEEIKNRALQQGYTKTQANKLAKKEAGDIFMRTVEACKSGSYDNSTMNTNSDQDSSTSSDGNW